jgi:hypothetical protein
VQVFPDLPPAWNLTTAGWQARLGEAGFLARAVAEELLEHPERWMEGHADGHVSLCRSDMGQQQPWERWYDLARETASRLPLTSMDARRTRRLRPSIPPRRG